MNRFAITVVLFASASIAFADVESGPKAGEKVSDFKVTIGLGDDAGKEINVAAADRKGATVYLFIRSDVFSRPMFRFMKELDAKLAEATEPASAVAVWLGDDANKDKEFLKRAEKSLAFTKTQLTVSSAGTSGPNGWGINSDAHLTVVIVAKGKVVKSFAFDTVNETDAKAVVETTLKAAK